MAGIDKYTAEQMIAALVKSGGIKSAAAKLLGCGSSTVKRYCKKYPTIQQAADEAREAMVDFAESQLIKQIRNGNMTAIIFYLKTMGKGRGYVEHPGFELYGDVTFTVKLPPELEAMRAKKIETYRDGGSDESDSDDQPKLLAAFPRS